MSTVGDARLSNHGLFCLLSAVAVAFLAPNVFVFSTDDLFIYVRAGSAKTFFMNQANEGRYSFTAICWLLNRSGLSISSYTLISMTSLSAALSFLFIEFTRCLKIGSQRAVVAGFLAFLFFGLNLDLFQFTFAQLSYAIGFACLGAVLRAAGRGGDGSVARLLVCSVLAAIAIGSYQLYIVYAFAALASIVFVRTLQAGLGGVDVRLVSIVVVSDLVGSAAYALINGVLRALRVSGFAAYPQREQGLAFVARNVERYLGTVGDLISLSERGAYSALVPTVVKVCFVLLVCSAVWRSRSRGAPALGALALALVAVVALWANPINMLLAAYWPSARSLSTLAIFVGAVVASQSEAALRGGDRGRQARLDGVAVGLLIAFEFMNAAVRFKDRSIRQVEDIALAQSIVSKVFDHRPDAAAAPLIVGTRRAPKESYFETAYDYGISMFQTPWSTTALFQYASDGRLLVKNDQGDRCRDEQGIYSITYGEADTLVCVAF